MSLLADSLPDRVAGIITRYSMIGPGDRIGVAVSGGADSVVLLHLLHRLSRKLDFVLVVLHANHRLRGAESDADEEFVRSLAQELRLEIRSERIGIERDNNLEQAARLARRAFFRHAMAACSLQRVALGHTKSDQAETILFRLLRGSGLRGLAAMRPVSEDGLIRPLLTSSRDDVRAWARAQGIQWRDDSSNTNLGFARNRLRHETIPALTRDFNPNLEDVLAGTAEVAQAEEDYWTCRIEPIFSRMAERSHWGLVLDVPGLIALHVAERRRVIRRAIEEVLGELRAIDLAHVDAILAMCSSSHGHDRVIVPGIDALRSFEKLRLVEPRRASHADRSYRLALDFNTENELPFRAGWLTLKWADGEASNCANVEGDQQVNTEIADLDGDALASAPTGSVYVRNWEPGDQLQRQGHSSGEKIKSLFQEQRIVLWERRHWPVVIAGEEIVWTRRFGAAAKFGKSAESRRIARLTYRASR